MSSQQKKIIKEEIEKNYLQCAGIYSGRLYLAKKSPEWKNLSYNSQQQIMQQFLEEVWFKEQQWLKENL